MTQQDQLSLEAISQRQDELSKLIEQFKEQRIEVPLLCLPPAKIELRPGETYLGLIACGRKRQHTILLPGDMEPAPWKQQMEWAKDIGGDLPDRVEAAIAFQQFPELFQRDAYWTNETHASDSACAWSQYFDYGVQGTSLKDYYLRARAFRRLPI